MHETKVEVLTLQTLWSKDALETQDMAAATSAHAACVTPPQATSSPSPPISAQATMDGVAAFCATHSPQLTPLSAGIIVCCERSDGKTKEYCWQGQGLLGKACVGPRPITRAFLGTPGLFFKDAVWDLLCASHTHSELAGQRCQWGGGH